MAFDAREIKALAVGAYITSPEYPGLRIEAFASCRTWTYRYRSPVDNKLRQVKIGTWPNKSTHAAIAEWEDLRRRREAGEDPALAIKQARGERVAAAAAKKEAARAAAYTVADVAMEYWEEHVSVNRKPKGVTEVKRMFDKMLGDTGKLPAASLTRSQAYDLIKAHGETKPVIAGYLRSELGAAWDHAYDAGRLPDTAPNWWRMILRGKLKSKGKKIAGESIGAVKRALSPVEAGQLIRWLPTYPRLVADVLTLYLWTCIRGGEIVSAEGREIARAADGQYWWTIPKAKTKLGHIDNATDLRVPLFGRALAVMLRRKEQYGDGLLFPARRRDGRQVPVEQKTIQVAVWASMPYANPPSLNPDRPRVPVTHWAPHDLRRTSRSFLASLGCPDEAAESILGHMLPGVVGVYNAYSYDAERVVWLKRLSDYLEELSSLA